MPATTRPKLQNVAEEARVSLTTASLALSGKGKISPAVRQRVAEAAERIGYRRRAPKAEGEAARGSVAILLPVEERWAHVFYFIRPIIEAIERSLVGEHLDPLLLPTFAVSDPLDIEKEILGERFRGVFSIHYGSDELFRRLERRGVPVVVVMNNNFQDTLHSVCVDDFQGAYEGCLHLIRLGHTGIGFVDYHRPELPAVVVDRFIGFRKAMEEFQIPFVPDQRLTTERGDYPALVAGLRALLGRQPPITALFVHDDYFAATVIAALAAMGREVPRDMSVIAPGDVLDYAQPFLPRITTMRINTELMGRIAADMMVNRLRRAPEDIHVLKVKQQLVDRGSCLRRT